MFFLLCVEFSNPLRRQDTVQKHARNIPILLTNLPSTLRRGRLSLDPHSSATAISIAPADILLAQKWGPGSEGDKCRSRRIIAYINGQCTQNVVSRITMVRGHCHGRLQVLVGVVPSTGGRIFVFEGSFRDAELPRLYWSIERPSFTRWFVNERKSLWMGRNTSKSPSLGYCDPCYSLL